MCPPPFCFQSARTLNIPSRIRVRVTSNRAAFSRKSHLWSYKIARNCLQYKDTPPEIELLPHCAKSQNMVLITLQLLNFRNLIIVQGAREKDWSIRNAARIEIIWCHKHANPTTAYSTVIKANFWLQIKRQISHKLASVNGQDISKRIIKNQISAVHTGIHLVLTEEQANVKYVTSCVRFHHE